MGLGREIMATLSEMQVYISKRLLDPNNTVVSLSDITEAINDSINYWKKRRFWFNEVSDTATILDQDPSFPYPTDFLVPATDDNGFNIHYGNMRYPLTKISQAQYDALFLDNGYGLPQWYARIGDEEYRCYPIPDRDYTVGRHYLKTYEPLVNPTDTNDFTEEADRLISMWATANLIAELRQDDKMEAYFRSAANDQYQNLGVMTRKANASGKLTIDSLLTT